MSTADEDFFDVLSTRSVEAEINRHTYLTENNRELAFLGTILLVRGLNILTLLSPPQQLKDAVAGLLEEKKDRYDMINEVLSSLTSDPIKLK